MDKYPMRNFLFNIFIHKKLFIYGRIINGRTQDLKSGLGLYCSVSSYIILIR